MPARETTREFLQQVGKYTLLDELGSGAVGVVYHARLSGPMGFRKQVALKTIRSELGRREFGMQSLVNEARVGGLLHHRNIVSILDFGQTDGAFYVAMEYAKGVTLDRILERISVKGPLPPQVVSGIAVQICNGLEYAHAATDPDGAPLHVVHRDLKPANVMVCDSGVVKLMDFGIVEAASNLYHDEPGRTAGTPAYMSPEQVMGKPLDGRSDLFSLATVLAEMITGEPVFKNPKVDRVLRRVLAVDVAGSLSRVRRHMPRSEPVLRRAWQRQPAGRFEDAGAMRDAIHRACREAGMRPLGEERLSRWLRGWMEDAPAGDGSGDDEDDGTVYSLDDGWSGTGSGDTVDPHERITTEYVPAEDTRAPVPGGTIHMDAPRRSGAEAAGETPSAESSWSDPVSYGDAPDVRAEVEVEMEIEIDETGTAPRTAAEPVPAGGVGAPAPDRAPPSLLWLSIPPGTLWRGSAADEPGHRPDEVRHEIVISRPFLVGATPVTQAQWRWVTGEDPPCRFPGAERPVDSVSWVDAVRFCNRWSERLGLAPAYQIVDERVVWDRESPGVRLLTEAEWEACGRAAIDAAPGGADALLESAWSADEAADATRPVARPRPGELVDLLGNVREWVWDRYDAHPEENVAIDPAGHWSGPLRGIRGGGYLDPRRELRLARRWAMAPDTRSPDLGFRVARTGEPDA